MTTAKSRFQYLDSKRTSHLERQRRCAELTIPSLLPPSGYKDENIALNIPWQSLGARGVHRLAAKLLLVLLPPNAPFFRLIPSAQIEADLKAAPEGTRTQLEQGLSDNEQIIRKWIEAHRIRVPLFRALKLLVATGNCLCYMPDTGGMKVYRLDQYVVQRDPSGNVIEILIREEVSFFVLPDKIKEIVENQSNNDSIERNVELFTHIRRDGDKFKVYQEVAGVKVPDSDGTYPVNACPWFPLRWTDNDGENYGRGLVDENLGDHVSLDALWKTIVEGSAAAAKLVFLVHPNGMTDEEDLTKAPNTGFVSGRQEDVVALQAQKFADFQIAYKAIEGIKEELSYAYLLNTSIQRNAERVTAEEIRYMAQELEDTLGGVYSILSEEFQLPLINRVIHIMRKNGELKFKDSDIQPTVLTGLEALGRGQDLNKLRQFIENLAPLGEQAVATWLQVNEYINRVATSLGIDPKGLIKTPQDVQQMMGMQQLQSFIDQAGPKVAQEMAKGMNQQPQG